MNRFALAALLLALACGDDSSTDASADASMDAAVDGGPVGPTVSAELLAGVDGAASLPRLGLFRTGSEPELVFGVDATSVLQPAGPQQIGLEEERVVMGWNDRPGTPFEWLTYPQGERMGQLVIGMDDTSVWLHYSSGSPSWLGEERITGPTVAIWSRDGSTERRPVPDGLTLSYLGSDPEGRSWVLGRGNGAVVVDGAPLGSADRQVLFLAEMDGEGLASPRVLTSVAESATPRLPDAALLPGGEVLLWLVVPEGELFGEPVIDHARLGRVDPVTGVATGLWEVPRTELRRLQDGRVELLASITETTTYGGRAYGAMTPFGDWDGAETWIRIVWDGEGDVIPEGETLALSPEELDETGGVRMTASWGRIAQLGEDGSIVRWFGASNGSLRGAAALGGRIYARVMAASGAVRVSLNVEDRDGMSMVPLESANPAESFWLVEIDAETGAIVRQKDFAVGPTHVVGEDRAEAYAQPLSEDLFLVATRPAGQPVADIRVDGWDLETPVPLTPSVAAESGCTTMVQQSELRLGAGLVPDPSVAHLTVRCESGPHRVELGGSRFDFAASASMSLFRITVD